MKKTIAVFTLVWISGITLSLVWNFRQQEENTLRQAAKLHFEQIVLMREWNARLNGVYTPVTETLHPNPYLEGSQRDLETIDGTRLTQINPAMMTRQISTLATEKKGIQFHITSLNPIRRQNKPTSWETNALNLFEKGRSSFQEMVVEHGERKYRYMAPLLVKRSCLKCHAKQGYKEGEVRGGISITFSLEKEMTSWPLWLTHVLVLVIGIAGLVLFNAYFEKNQKKVSCTEECLAESVRNLELTQSKLEDTKQLIEIQDHLKAFITTAQYLTSLHFSQSVRDETRRIIIRSFAADLICFIGKDKNGEAHVLSKLEKAEATDLLTPDVLENIQDVVESEVLTTCRIDKRSPLAVVIFPLRTHTPINEVLLIGHKGLEEISTSMLEIYLGIAGLAETMIHRHSLNDQMIEANKSLERKVEERTRELNGAYQKMTTLANTDPLTKLFNRRNMQEKLNHEVTRYQRKKAPFTLILCDIDHFKKVNDQYGHDCGDYILTAVTGIMRTTIRQQDILARWGGEEFLFLLPDTDRAGGRTLAEKIRQTVAGEDYIYQEKSISVSITLGVCEFDGSMDIATCINKADSALYRGKNSGRNCVYLA